MHAPSILVLAGFVLGGTALGQVNRPPPSPLSSPGVVLGELHAVNNLEIELGNLAQANAADAQVKTFGEHLVKAHTKMDAHVNDYARKFHLTVTPPPRDPEHQVEENANDELKTRLRALKGSEFERTYVQAMADGHAKVLAKLTAWEAQTQDKNLRSFISEASKEVAAHKQQAEDLLTKLGKSAAL